MTRRNGGTHLASFSAKVALSALERNKTAVRRLARQQRRRIREFGLKRRILAAVRAPGRALRQRMQEGAAARAWAAPERLRWLRPVLRVVRALAPRWLAAAQAEALLVARTEGWAAAAPRFRAMAAEGMQGEPALGLLAPAAEQPAARLLAPDPLRPARLPAERAARIVLYTTVIGLRPQLPPLYGIPDGMRCICFTDSDVAAPGWEIHPPAGPDDAHHRIRADEVLAGVAPEATASLYLAPGRLLVGNLDTLIGRWLVGADLAMWRHTRNDWQAMAEDALIAKHAFPAPGTEALLAQAAACEAAGLAREAGAFDTGVIWRRHADTEVAALMARWQERHAAATGDPDISFYQALHGPVPPETVPAIPPDTLGPGWDNPYFARHRRRAAAPRPTSAGRRLPVVFLYSGDAAAPSGGTYLRSFQLSQLIAAHCSERFEVSLTSDIHAPRDAVVIVTLLALKAHSSRRLAALARRNVAVIGDWLDGTIEPAKARLIDAHMALGMRQALDLNRLYPGTPAFNVTHHVNLDIPARRAPDDRLRTGYFGAPFNTTLPGSLAGAVDLVVVANLDSAWIDELANYNCHWVVRVDPGFADYAGWKPFLKGFVAARSGAVVITTRDDPNAVHYLGDDYPFYAESLASADLEMAWARVAGSFGGPDWRLAQEIMRQVGARSSDAQVAAEFTAMIDEILA